MRGVLGHRDARIYLTGQVFSLFGDSCLYLAMGIWVKTLTHSNAAAGLTFFFLIAPSLVAPAASLIVDRMRRRPLLIAVNVLTGGVVLLLLAVQGAGQVWLIYVVMALYGLSHSLLSSAQSALLTVMLPADLLPEANAGLRTAQEALRLIGPLAGAGLFVAVGGHVIAIIDAATFVPPVICLLALRIAEPAPHPLARHWRKEINLQGRAYSAATTLVTTPQTISIVTGAALISVIGYRPLLAAMATVVAFAAAYLLSRVGLRHQHTGGKRQVKAHRQATQQDKRSGAKTAA